MDELEKDILIEMAMDFKRIADSLERIEANTAPQIITQEAHKVASQLKETLVEIEYKENGEIGKGDVPVKTCGQEVCRCLRQDGSCSSHHPEFCKKCKELNS